MENQPIITIKGVGKRYNINHQHGRYLALRDVIMNIVRSPFKYLKTKAKKMAGIETKEEFWALKDVSATIQKGEVIGIIGPNGSGKSTLLKILTGITPPTEGEIVMYGKVASLLEVGTGFHPELTGRENIFLNAAIIGMSRKEVTEKFDAIVEFSGVGKFLDTPVKYYSSGMYVRLAFSVAAHMEPDILLVDEVLAVGDAEFQKKCLGKMEEVTSQDGRTILFVSHNMAAIAQLCTKCILLKKGKVEAIGDTKDVINQYLQSIQTSHKASLEFPEDTKKEFQILSLQLKNDKGQTIRNFTCDEDVFIEIGCMSRKPLPDLYGDINLFKDGSIMLDSDSFDTGHNEFANLPEGRYLFSLKIPKRTLGHGVYDINIAFASSHASSGFKVDGYNGITSFQVNDYTTDRGDRRGGHFSMLIDWKMVERK